MAAIQHEHEWHSGSGNVETCAMCGRWRGTSEPIAAVEAQRNDYLSEYEAERGYRLPDGITREVMESCRAQRNIDDRFVPLACGHGATAWGIPLVLHDTAPGVFQSHDGRFVARMNGLVVEGILMWEVTDSLDPERPAGRCATLNAAGDWCIARIRATS